jgi:hypothetical protein
VVTPSASGDTFFKKSYAQVETSVGQNVPSKSCEQRSRGRKSKSKHRKYPPPLRVRYPTYEERDGVIRAAMEAGFKSVSSYLRALSRGPGYKPPRDPELTRALLLVNRELTRQGNNLNQIAKHKNSGGTAAEAEGMLGIVARSMLQTHKALRQVLSQGNPEPGAMIIKSHIRGGYRAAADYLKEFGKNEEIRLVEISDPDAKNLDEAFHNMWTIASNTKARKPLHHISINPFVDWPCYRLSCPFAL